MRKSKGFTLVELMIVIAVIAILATLALTGFRTAQASARDTQRQQNVKGLQVALECYYGENGDYPATAEWDNTTAWDNQASLQAVVGNCWTGGDLDNNPTGDTVNADGTVDRPGSTGVATYIYTSDAETYDIVLQGETKTLTFESPT